MIKLKSTLYNLSIAIAITLFFKLLFFNIKDFLFNERFSFPKE